MGRVLHLQPTNHHHWLLLLLWSSFINSVKLICLNQLTLAAQLWKWKKIPMKEKFFVFCTKLYFFRQRLLLSLSLHICSSYKQKKTQQKLINLISSKVNKRNNSTDLLTYLLGSRKIFRSSLNCYLLLVLDSILTTSIVTFTGSLISVQLSSAPPKSNIFELWWRPPVDWGRVHEHWRPHNNHHGWNEDLKNTLSDVGTHLNNLS